MTPGGIVIWDFNGTLLDDVECGIKSINVLLSRRGLPTVKSQEQYRSLFRFHARGLVVRRGGVGGAVRYLFKRV